MPDSTRIQGALICVGVVIAGLLFTVGLFSANYWALAIPVAALVFFGLGLTFWVGFTIATIRVEPEDLGDEAGDAASEPASDEHASNDSA